MTNIDKQLLEKARENSLKNPIILENITKQTGIPNGSRDRKRELVRIRDGKTCQICGKKWKKGQRRFDVHHIDGTPEDTRKTDTDFDHEITLCHRHHLIVDGWKMSKVHKKTKIEYLKSQGLSPDEIDIAFKTEQKD